MDWLINWELIRRPTSVFTIWAMVILGAFTFHFALSLIKGSNPNQKPKHPSKIS